MTNILERGVFCLHILTILMGNYPVSIVQTNRSPSLFSNRIWLICSEIKPSMNIKMEVVKSSALMLVNRPEVKKV